MMTINDDRTTKNEGALAVWRENGINRRRDHFNVEKMRTSYKAHLHRTTEKNE